MTGDQAPRQNRDGHPWGFLASVNDLFKTAKADKPDDILAAVHPDALGGGFTYTSIHELSHFLGLAHPHDTIGKWVNPSTGKEEYWDGFTWTFDTTENPEVLRAQFLRAYEDTRKRRLRKVNLSTYTGTAGRAELRAAVTLSLTWLIGSCFP